jgi:hypothetical protein
MDYNYFKEVDYYFKEMDYYFKEMDYYFAIFAINSKNIDAPTPALKSLGQQLCYDYLLQQI